MKKTRMTLAALAVGFVVGMLGASVPAVASVSDSGQKVEAAQGKCPKYYCGTPCRWCGGDAK